jgi:hypothetical protein
MTSVTRKATFDVWYDDEQIGRHFSGDECYETIIKHRAADTSPALGVYQIRIGAEVLYEIDMGLIARTVVPPDPATDQPPTVVSTPNPQFTVGTAGTYDLKTDFSDDGLSAVTWDITGALGAGLSVNTSTGILSYDGVGAASSNSHTATATDAVGVATTPSFTISVTELPSNAFVAHTPTLYVPRVYGVAGHGMDSAFGTASAGESTVTVRVQRVTSTSDGAGDGTFRFAAALTESDRTVVVFDADGFQVMGSNLSITQGNKTFAFNTAPGDGYYLRGAKTRVTASDILIWHGGFSAGGTSPGDDSFAFAAQSTHNNLALVNCAFWLGADEAMEAVDAQDMNIYSCLFSHTINQPPNNHKFGPLLDRCGDVSFYRSYIAHMQQRSPRIAGEVGVDIANNVMYNCGGIGVSNMYGQNNVPHIDNIWRNLYVDGPDSGSGTPAIVVNESQNGTWNPGGQVYIGDGAASDANTLVGYTTLYEDDVPGQTVTLASSALSAAIPHGNNSTPINTLTNLEAFNLMTGNVGPRPASRLAYFQEVIDNGRNAIIGSGSLGSYAGDNPTQTYSGGTAGYDDISGTTTDNFAALDSFLSANYSTPADYQLVSTGTNHRTYRFEVDSGTGYTPIDVWLNESVNDGVMNAGWET